MQAIKNIKVFTHKSNLKCLKYTLNGKQYCLYGHSKKECLQKYADIKRTTKKTTLSNKLFIVWYEKWIQLYKQDLKENTLNTIKGVFKNYILPYIAKKQIRRITSLDIQEIINGVSKYPRQQTVVYMQLNACLNQAYKLNLIDRNPCLACVIKKTKGNKGKGLTKSEQIKLLEYMKANYKPVNNLVLIYLNTGMRCSELLAITQEDINRETNEIHIKGTKTITSDRILQTSKDVIDLIPNKAKPFEDWNKDKVEREFKKITTELNFNKISIHSLRHTFATNCVESGVDMVVVQKWLGHASITMTMDRYTHISEDYKKDNLKKIKILK